MKKQYLFAILAAFLLAACTKTSVTESNIPSSDEFSTASFNANDVEVTTAINSKAEADETTLTPEEIEGLRFMREEEKVARDVYQKMYETYGLLIFRNIKQSEQVHMNALKILLNRFNIPDPVATDVPGVFVNPELQALYDALIIRGLTSQTEALTVGKDIELADIADLENQIDNVVTNAYVLRVYTNLNRASHFHLRAFNYQLQNNGSKQ